MLGLTLRRVTQRTSARLFNSDYFAQLRRAPALKTYVFQLVLRECPTRVSSRGCGNGCGIAGDDRIFQPQAGPLAVGVWYNVWGPSFILLEHKLGTCKAM